MTTIKILYEKAINFLSSRENNLYIEYILCSILYYIGALLFFISNNIVLFFLSPFLPIISIIYYKKALYNKPRFEYPKISWKIWVLLKLLRIKVYPIEKYYPKELSIFYKDTNNGGLEFSSKYLPRGCSGGRYEICIDRKRALNYTYLHEIGHSLAGGTLCCNSHTEFSAHFIAVALGRLFGIKYWEEEDWDTSIDQLALTNPNCVRLERRKYYMDKNRALEFDFSGDLEKEYNENEKHKKEIEEWADETLKLLEEGR